MSPDRSASRPLCCHCSWHCPSRLERCVPDGELDIDVTGWFLTKQLPYRDRYLAKGGREHLFKAQDTVADVLCLLIIVNTVVQFLNWPMSFIVDSQDLFGGYNWWEFVISRWAQAGQSTAEVPHRAAAPAVQPSGGEGSPGAGHPSLPNGGGRKVLGACVPLRRI